MMSTTTNGKATTRNGNLADGNGRPETHNNMLQDCATPREVINALRLVAQHFDGEHGVWAYDVFDAINASYFEGRLPTPKIQWALTAHGRCLGLTRSTARPVVQPWEGRNSRERPRWTGSVQLKIYTPFAEPPCIATTSRKWSSRSSSRRSRRWGIRASMRASSTSGSTSAPSPTSAR